MVRITVNANETLKFLADAAAKATNAGPAWRVIAMRLRSDTIRNFAQGGWFPTHWAPSKRGGQTLVDTATLRNSIHAGSGADFAVAGTDVKYAAVHQFGATIVPKKGKYLKFKIGDRWVSKKSVTIPARPFLPVDDSGNLSPGTMRFVIDTIAKHVIGAA